MKMFVWTKILYDYNSGLVCIMAETLEQAVQIIIDKSKEKEEGSMWCSAIQDITAYAEIDRDTLTVEDVIKNMKVFPRIFIEPNGVATYGGG